MEDDLTHDIGKFFQYLTDDPIGHIHINNLDMKANHIYLFGEESYVLTDGSGQEPGVEYTMANRFIKNLNILMRKSNKPILVHLKSCGGMWEEGMAIFDAIRACPNKITILNYTHARSMSSIIFCAGDKKVMMPHSKFMFHEGTMTMDGTVKQYRTEGEQLSIAGDDMMRVYVNTMKEQGKLKKWSRARIEEWLVERMDKKEEVYLNSKQTVEYGFADYVFGGDGKYDWKELLNFDDDE